MNRRPTSTTRRSEPHARQRRSTSSAASFTAAGALGRGPDGHRRSRSRCHRRSKYRPRSRSAMSSQSITKLDHRSIELGDHTHSPTASARMCSLIEIETTTMTEVSQSHKSSGTTEVDLYSGVQKGFAVANMSRCKYSPNPSMTSYAFYRRLEAAAGDPLVGMAADIDYKGTLILTMRGAGPTAKVIVDFEGMVDNFPAYECYATLNGTTNKLFQMPPPAGNTVADLLGGANNPEIGRAHV